MTPDDTQILFCDLQPAIIARSRTNPPEALAASAGVLAGVAQLLGLPMIVSVVAEGGDRPDLIAPPRGHGTAATVFARRSANPFLDPSTAAAIRAQGRRTLVFAGFAIEVVSLHAALSARRAGYAVELPVDANGGMSQRSETAVLRQVENAGGVITSVSTLAIFLAPDFATPTGSQVSSELQTLRLA